ncbi:methyltransferase family protein [Comamonas sp. BIGb0124]|uniref:class I SAM-dependent methyltransferase n=1 Tax=Comamonas sp. BIGb0124 TaxID=2485130 RepID=UPI000F46F615|nr:class I SAM-dependent methyltransferase [Comamonas sp. BIGb0124]ROR20235.1 methyltransferase family protein [Comamonas sp. BIGb0124]
MTTPSSPTAASRAHFEQLYRQDADPWQVGSRWYERRKRALVLAALPRERYGHVLDAGCGTGDTAFALAERCDELLAVDYSRQAVSRLQARLAGHPVGHLSVACMDLTGHWPSRRFDLIVVSELAYYFSPAQAQSFIARCQAGLAPGGELAMCHYLPDFDDRQVDTETLHGYVHACHGLQPSVAYRDRDFLLDIWRAG